MIWVDNTKKARKHTSLVIFHKNVVVPHSVAESTVECFAMKRDFVTLVSPCRRNTA